MGQGRCFNPRPLLLTGESKDNDGNAFVAAWFQSTPVIANGRIAAMRTPPPGPTWFQSTPVIANGRINGWSQSTPWALDVSIHARYC